MRSDVTPEQVALRLRQPVVLAPGQTSTEAQAQSSAAATSSTFTLSHADIAAEHSLILNLCRAMPRRRAFSQDQAFRELALALVEHRLLVFTVQEEDVLRSRRQAHRHPHHQQRSPEEGYTADTSHDRDDDGERAMQPKVLVTDAATWYPYLLMLRLLLRDAALMAMLVASFPDLLRVVGDLATFFFCAGELWDEAEEEGDDERATASDSSPCSASNAPHQHEQEQGREDGHAVGERQEEQQHHRGQQHQGEQQGREEMEQSAGHAPEERGTLSASWAQLGLPRVAHERVCVELAAIVQRLARHPDGPATLVCDACRTDEALVLLMGHDKRSLFASAAHALLALALSGTPATRELMAESSAVSLCLQALDSATGELRLTLLRLLVALGEQKAARRDMVVYDAPRQFTALLQVPDLDVRLAAVHCIERLCTEHEDEVRLSGLVPQLAKVLANYVADTASGDDGDEDGVDALVPLSSSTVTSLPPPIQLASPTKHTALKCSAMSALTALCVQEAGAVQVQECNVIYFTARLLVAPVLQAHRDGLLAAATTAAASAQGSRATTPATAAGMAVRARMANAGGRGVESRGDDGVKPVHASGNTATAATIARDRRRPSTAPRKSRAYKPPTQAMMEQACAMRLLRFLFSAERNRRYFKRLFPPDLFSWFIDVGHYQGELPVYLRLVRHLYRMTPPAIERMEGAVEDTNVNKQPSRHVSKYGLLEKLGEGSFGCVYRAVRAGTEQMYAVKEIPLRNPAVFGQSDTEQDKALQRIENEVRIMQGGLRHPNVVRYESSFVEGNTLYIVMEMVEGASLQDHFNALVEKRQSMDERRVWRIFVQICNGLHYMHCEKKVVHRDLSPSNVMLGWYDKVTIVDFGLSRQRNTGNTLMESSVGTLSYSCPEIVTNQKYNDKADIWALGCLLYQLATLRPPFATSNMLALAKRIVEGTYDPIPDKRSEMLRDTVSVCLTPNPDLRPDVTEVCQAIGPALMVELDALTRTMEAKDRMIDRERTLKRRFRRDAKAAQDAVQRLLAASKQVPLCGEQLSSSLSSASFAYAGVGSARGEDRDGVLEGRGHHHHYQHQQQRRQQQKERGGSDAEADRGSRRERALWQTHGDDDTVPSQHNDHVGYPAGSRDDDDDEDDVDAELVEDVFASPTATMRPPSATTAQRRQSLRRKASHLKHSASTSVLDPRKEKHQQQAARGDEPALGTLQEMGVGNGGDERYGQGARTLSEAAGVGDASATNRDSRHHQYSDRAQSQVQRKRQRHSTRTSVQQGPSPSPSGHATPRTRSAARGRPSTSTAGVIRLPASKLRPVSDPIVLLLTQLKKVMFVCMQPPDVRANPARHVVVRFQQTLFKPCTTSAAMKEHLRKLKQAVPLTIVDIDFGIAGRYAREIALRDSTEAARALSRLQRQASSSSSLHDPALALPEHSDDGGASLSPVRAAPTPTRSAVPTRPAIADHTDEEDVTEREARLFEGACQGEQGNDKGNGSRRHRAPTNAYLVRVPSMEDGNPVTSDMFVARNTLTYQQLHRVVELELQRCGYYDNARSSNSKPRRSTTTDK